MQRKFTVNLGNLVISLSNAMDLASPSLIQHQQRAAFIVWKMGKAAKLPDERLEKLFIAALLHDIGAFSLEEKIRIRNSEDDDTEQHCIRAELLLNNIPWLKDSAKTIRHHHKGWKHWKESIESPIVLESQLLFLGDYVERQIRRDDYILHQHEAISRKVNALSGASLNPRVVDLFMAVSRSEEFWLDLISPRLHSYLLDEGPFRNAEVDFDDIVVMSELFRNIIDFKSRFTSTHSSGVAASASMLARIFGLTDTEIGLMKVAGNLHDIGKLSIPNSILEKPGKLSKEEMAVMKSHTYYTYFVINTIGGLKHIAEWAAYHHEKLDGSGYPFRCTGAELSIGARIMTVADIFTALAEDRPYRKGMRREAITQIFKRLAGRGLLDGGIIRLLFENYNEVLLDVTEKQASAKAFYEKQFAVGRS